MAEIMRSPEVRLGTGIALGRVLAYVFPYITKKVGVTTVPGYLTNLVGGAATLYLNKKVVPAEYRDIVSVGAITVMVDSIFDWLTQMGWIKLEESNPQPTSSFQNVVYYPEEEEKKAQMV